MKRVVFTRLSYYLTYPNVVSFPNDFRKLFSSPFCFSSQSGYSNLTLDYTELSQILGVFLNQDGGVVVASSTFLDGQTCTPFTVTYTTEP